MCLLRYLFLLLSPAMKLNSLFQVVTKSLVLLVVWALWDSQGTQITSCVHFQCEVEQNGRELWSAYFSLQMEKEQCSPNIWSWLIIVIWCSGLTIRWSGFMDEDLVPLTVGFWTCLLPLTWYLQGLLEHSRYSRKNCWISSLMGDLNIFLTLFCDGFSTGRWILRYLEIGSLFLHSVPSMYPTNWRHSASVSQIKVLVRKLTRC